MRGFHDAFGAFGGEQPWEALCLFHFASPLRLLITCSIAAAIEPVSSQFAIEVKYANVAPFVTEGRGEQVLRISGEYHGITQPAEFKLDGKKVGHCVLTDGQFHQQVSIPAAVKETRSTLVIKAAGKGICKTEIVRRPVRELTIYIIPHSHVDIGYTELQPAIETKQVNNLLTALELIEKTKGNPPGSRYCWNVEAAWTIDNLLRDRPDKVMALQQAIQSKQIELDGAFANLLTGLCRPEELIRAYAWGRVMANSLKFRSRPP